MKPRKLIFWLHLITGVVAGLVILVMCVTGVLLTYQRQITAWVDGSKVVAPTAGAARLPVETLLAKVQEAQPGATPSAITVNSELDSAATVSFGREKTLFVNPYTGDVLGEGSQRVRKFFQWLIEWHRWLGRGEEQRAIGKAITGACNLGFLFLVVSGFYLWWPRKWNRAALKSVTWFGSGLRGKARDWNWHNVIGFWSAIPLFFVVLTAVFFSYPWATDLLHRVTGDEPPPRQQATPGGARGGRFGGERRGEGREARRDGGERKPMNLEGLNQAWAKAEQQMEGWRTITFRVPSSPTAPLVFAIDKGSGARPDLRGQLTLAAKTAEMVSWETYESYNAARQIRLWVRWIHTGEAGGWLGQTVAGLASLGGAVLVWTGFALAWRRFRARKRQPEIPLEEPAEARSQGQSVS